MKQTPINVSFHDWWRLAEEHLGRYENKNNGNFIIFQFEHLIAFNKKQIYFITELKPD